MGISQLLANYSNTHRKPFNEELFTRSEYDIIEDVKKVILSVASSNPVNVNHEPLFIGINGFRVYDDYREVVRILHELESEENRHNKRIDYNIHDYINLKDSAIILLEVSYHVELNGESNDFSVFIDIPKVIDKYYFRIDGTIYSALYQIADASTYNNSSSKKKTRCVTFRQEFQKHVVYEKIAKINQMILNDKGEYIENPIHCYEYTTDLFGNNIPLCKYFLAKYGLIEAMNYLRLQEIYFTVDKPYVPNDGFIIISKPNCNLYVSVPYTVWESSKVTQSFIYTVLYNTPKKCTTPDIIYTKEFWLMMLGSDFKNKSIEKGLSMLGSTEKNYSIIMKEGLRLPDEEKQNLLDVLRWEMYEFDNLYNKDNYDMTYKKIRLSAYIAGYYAAKLTKNIIGVTNSVNSLNINKLSKALNIRHDFILTNLKGNLFAYKNGVNDDDTFAVLKYTFKGTSGIGENKASAVPVKYRLANPSHIGKVDCDTSPAGDPGMTGLLCPYAEIQPNGYLGDYKEPCSWREIQDNLIDEYRKMFSIASIFQTKEELLGTNKGKEFINTLMNKAQGLIPFTVGNDPEIK